MESEKYTNGFRQEKTSLGFDYEPRYMRPCRVEPIKSQHIMVFSFSNVVMREKC